MRKISQWFPEAVMIDATHGTNKQRYKLFSFMVVDAFGKGQYAQHTLEDNERKQTLVTALEQFKESNPAWAEIKCVIIDKDFTELSVLREHLPGLKILLCQFHVVKYLTVQIKKYDFHPQKELLAGALSLLVKSVNQDAYNKQWDLILHLANAQLRESSRDEEHPFISYFKRNWSSCVEMCCSMSRIDSVTLGTDTNNHLEATWK